MSFENEKVFFLPGERVIIKHDIEHRPTMVVLRKDTKMIRSGSDDKGFLNGMVCFWFTSSGEYQERVFSTKDLQKI